MEMSITEHTKSATAPTLIVALLTVLVGCASEVSPPPEQILGIWSTDSERYAGRTFEIRTDAIVFVTGEFSPPILHSLAQAEALPESNSKSRWRLHYRETDGTISTLDLDYRPTPEPTLQFANRKEIWKRVINKKGASDA